MYILNKRPAEVIARFKQYEKEFSRVEKLRVENWTG